MQPAGETPLIQPAAATPLPAVAAAVPPMMAELAGVKAGVLDAAGVLAASLMDQLQAAKIGILNEAQTQAQSVQDQLLNVYGAVAKDVERQVRSVTKKLSDAELGLWQEGVVTPVTQQERLADLESGSFDPFAQRFAQTVIGTPSTEAAAPSPATSSGYGDSVPVIPTETGYECPVGYYPVMLPDGPRCFPVPPPVPPFSPPPATPPVSPPLVPPPATVPPAVPPAVPPIGVPGVPPATVPPPASPLPTSACDPRAGDPAVQVACFQLPPPPIIWHWWVALDCTDCTRPKACVYQGTQPPVVYVGRLLPRIWDVQPTQPELEALVRECAVPAPGSPPTSPPGSPPTSPPAPGDDTTTPAAPVCAEGEDDGTFAAGLAGEWISTNTAGELCPVSTTTAVVPKSPWSAYEDCFAGKQALIDRLNGGAGQIASNQNQGNDWKEWLKVFAWTNPATMPIAALYSALKPDEALPKFKAAAGEAVDVAAEGVASLIEHVSGRVMPNKRSVLSIGTAIGAGNKLEALTGFPMSYCMTPAMQMLQYADPVYIPGQPEIDLLWCSQRISDDAWTCYTRANGNIPSLFSPIRDMKRVRPNVNEVVQLSLRNGFALKDDTVTKRLRDLGVYDLSAVEEFQTLAQWQPQPPDIITYMVRDVFDPETVKKYGLDSEFDQKYTDQADTLGTAVGLTKDTARYFWRAHWHTPSDTALYTMVQRLYPDRPEVVAWDKARQIAITPEAIAALGPRPPVFTTDDLKYALKINDNLPTFVDALTAIQYHPVTNTDAYRMYELSVIDKDEMTDRIRQNGYTLDNAKLIAKFYATQKAKRLANDSGVWTSRKTVAAYKAGTIDRATAQRLLTRTVGDPMTAAELLDDAILELKAETKAKEVKALKKRFMYGEFDGNTLAIGLKQIGIEGLGIEATVNQWEAERRGRSKEPRATQLCQWLDAGLITKEEYFDRLTRLGYTPDDASRISQLCQAGNQLRRTKQAAAAAEKQRREIERALRAEKADLEGKIKALKLELEALTEAAMARRF